MIGQKVVCIDAGNRLWCISHGMAPLVEGRIYTIRGEQEFGKGIGWLFEEIQNPICRTEVRCAEPSYAKHRFIPLSDIDETETVLYEDYLCQS